MKISPCLGIPVRFDERMQIISDSRGIGPWKEIVVGPAFMQFGSREKTALLLHEAAHCKMRHVEKRLLRFWMVFWPPALFRYCREQEYAADRFVRELGFGPDLARVFARIQGGSGPLHPPHDERIHRLNGQMPVRVI